MDGNADIIEVLDESGRGGVRTNAGPTLTEQDWQCLCRGQWLNDNVSTACITYYSNTSSIIWF